MDPAAAIACLTSPLATPDQRRAAEAWAGSEAAWGWCVATLAAGGVASGGGGVGSTGGGSDQQVVAQILRHKVFTQGWQLPAQQLWELRDFLLRRLHGASQPNAVSTTASGTSGGGSNTSSSAVVGELLLSLAGVFFLSPDWADPVSPAAAALAPHHAARFLQLLAEEAGGELRRLRAPPPAAAAAAAGPGGGVGGSTPPVSTAQLAWVAAAKARLLTNCGAVTASVLQLMNGGVPLPSGGAGGVLPTGPGGGRSLQEPALLCLMAWVRLGLLREVDSGTQGLLLQATLQALQSADERVFTAACSVMEEVAEFAPDSLLDALHPQMLEVAAAAASAAAAGRTAHAAAWCRAFSAFAAARPAALLSAGRASDAAAREALLQLALLPHLDKGDPIALPALEVWAALLDDEQRPGGGGGGGDGALWRAASGTATDDREGSPVPCAAHLEDAAALLQYGLATNLLIWSHQAPSALEALGGTGTTGVTGEASPGDLPDQIWRAACRALGAPAALSAALSLAGLPTAGPGSGVAAAAAAAAARRRAQLTGRASVDSLGPTPPGTPPAGAGPRSASGVGGATGDGAASSAASSGPRQGWRRDMETAHEAARALAPSPLRLLWALRIAAAVAAAVSEDGAVVGVDQGTGFDESLAPSDAAGADMDPAAAAGPGCRDAGECGALVLQLLLPAAQLLQGWLAAGAGGGVAGGGNGLPDGFAAAFCRVVQGWAGHLLTFHTAGGEPPEDRLRALLDLVLSLAQADPTSCQSPACAAARALVRTAASGGAGGAGGGAAAPLHVLTPALLRALQGPPGGGGVGAAAEGDLIDAISASLVGPVGGSTLEVEAAREETARLLLQPLHGALAAALTRLRSGEPWASLHGTTLEAALLHGMARARALVDALPPAGAAADGGTAPRGSAAAGAAAALSAGAAAGGGRYAAAGDREEGDPMESGATSAADAVEELTARAARLTTGSAPPAAGGAGSGGGSLGGSPRRGVAAAGRGAATGANSGGGAHVAVVGLLTSEVWPLAQALCLEGCATGRFLHLYAKASGSLLRAAPDAALPLLPQMMAVCGAAFARPGGYSLGDVLVAAVLAYCRADGPRGTLDCGPHVAQALFSVFAHPDVSSLRTPGAGDQRPDLAEATLRVATAAVKHAPTLLSSRPEVLDSAVLFAAACAGCRHRRAAGAALSLLSALATAAAGGAGGGAAAALAGALAARGPDVFRGLVAALLAPSPLPRVHKVASLLLDLSNLASAAPAAASRGAAAAPATTAATTGASNAAQTWLGAALAGLPPGALAPGEAAVVLAEWGPVLGAHHSARSYVSLRRLRRILREFAETHARR